MLGVVGLQARVGEVVSVVLGDGHIVAAHQILPLVGVLVVAVAGGLGTAVVGHQTLADVIMLHGDDLLGGRGLLGHHGGTLGNGIGEGDLHVIDRPLPCPHLGGGGAGIILVQAGHDIVLVGGQEGLAVQPLAHLVDLVGLVGVVPDPDGGGPQVYVGVNGHVHVLVHACLTVVCHLYDVALQLITVGGQQTAAADVAQIIEDQNGLLLDVEAKHDGGIVDVGGAVGGIPGLEDLDLHAVDLKGQTLGHGLGVDDRAVDLVVVVLALTDGLTVLVDVLLDLGGLHVGVLTRVLGAAELGEVEVDVVDLVVGISGVLRHHLGQLVDVILVSVGEEPSLHFEVFAVGHTRNGAERGGHVRGAVQALTVDTAVNDDELAMGSFDDVGLHQTVLLGHQLVQNHGGGLGLGDLLGGLLSRFGGLLGIRFGRGFGRCLGRRGGTLLGGRGGVCVGRFLHASEQQSAGHKRQKHDQKLFHDLTGSFLFLLLDPCRGGEDLYIV